jgi:hypothetical protein
VLYVGCGVKGMSDICNTCISKTNMKAQWWGQYNIFCGKVLYEICVGCPESKDTSRVGRMTEHASNLAGLWIGAAISNVSHSNKAGFTTVKRARLTGKGSRSTTVLPQ